MVKTPKPISSTPAAAATWRTGAAAIRGTPPAAISAPMPSSQTRVGNRKKVAAGAMWMLTMQSAKEAAEASAIQSTNRRPSQRVTMTRQSGKKM